MVVCALVVIVLLLVALVLSHVQLKATIEVALADGSDWERQVRRAYRAEQRARAVHAISRRLLEQARGRG